jgi:hypothetical protein
MFTSSRSQITPSLLAKAAPLACGLLALAAFTAAGTAQPASTPIPSIEKKDGAVRLLVDGNPYLMLGGQVHNSDTANADDLNKALDVLASWHANTAEVPIYWEAIEPQPGQFDFRSVDLAIQAARKRELHLVFLWFGTWKNGESHYVPEWVKRDKQKYTRVLGPRGEETEIISPLCRAAMEADAHAFAALLQHVKSIDAAERTVLIVQVENEPGLVGTDRDYSPDASQLFEGPVPRELVNFLESHSTQLSAPMAGVWSKSPKSGNWKQVFGEMAPEAFSAWLVSNYINTVATAGKHEYPLPMYVNVSLIEGDDERPGRWPSGGATVNVLDVWKAAAPAIDILAPDIYYPKFYDAAAQYNRPDNPLFVPETSFNPYFIGFAYTTFGFFNGMGFSPFAIDDVLKGGAPAAIGAGFEDTYSVLRPMLPLIARYQYTGKLHPILQGLANGEDWKESIRVGDRLAANIDFTATFDPMKGRASGMIIELAPDDFVVMGTGFDVTFREMEGPLRDAQLISIEEGTFQGDQWVASRRLNGDERHVSLPEKSTILRVRVAR